MYICLCMGLTDSELTATIKSGKKTLNDLMEATGAGLGCSMCKQELENLIINENKCGYMLPIIELTVLDTPL